MQHKEILISQIVERLQTCADDSLLDFILQLLLNEGSY